MPVSSETSISGPYTPNGVTTSFAFDFKAASASEVVATDGDGNVISTALYSVTLDDDEGGTLTFGTAPEASDYSEIYVLSEPELTQPSDFDNAGPSFNPAALTRAIDRAAIRDLKLNRDIGRALKLPFGEVPITFPGVADRANKYLSFLPDGSLLMSSGTGADSGLREDIASSTGGAMVGFIQTGTGAEARTIEAKARDIVSALDFGAVGDGVTDDSAALQAAADALTDGGSLLLPRGNYFLDSGITVSNSNVVLDFEDGAVITYTDATMTPITLASDNSGIKGGRIDAPAVFDGTNGAITYAVVRAQGEYNVISGLTISNVPRVGIWFDDCTNGIVSGCIIDGGTGEGFFTGTNTVHFGIAIDVAATGSQGNFAISGNIIRRCVQGAGSGSVGAATFEQSMAVTGNVFELCWNHGWYTSGLAHGISVTGNAFNACQIPIALTGWDHAVVGNTLTVQTSGTGVATDNEITGISLRDPVRCVVSSNVIKGEGVASGVVIGLDDNSGVPGADAVTDNIVSDNTITITNSTVAGVVAIRLLSSTGAVSNNIVEGNTVNAPLRSGDALLIVQGAASLSFNNAVRGNVLNMTGIRGSGYAILAVNLDTTDISNNIISIQCDASSAMILTLVGLVSCSYAAARNNLMSCTAAWGDDISVRCFQEITSATGNVATSNLVRMDLTKLTAFDVFLSPMIIDHTAAGDPEGAILARVGSVWRRTDGGASTTLYIKESGTSNTGWIAK